MKPLNTKIQSRFVFNYDVVGILLPENTRTSGLMVVSVIKGLEPLLGPRPLRIESRAPLGLPRFSAIYIRSNSRSQHMYSI